MHHRKLTASEPNHNPIGVTSTVPGRSDPGFGESSRYPSGSPNDNPTKDSSPMPIIKPKIGLIETPTKDPSHVTKEL